MNRRKFIQQTALAAPLLISFNPFACNRNLFSRLRHGAENDNRILVLIQLNGGNDGLNTVIPIDKYNILSEARKDILIPENKILKLSDSSVFGFHPSMELLQKLYNDKLMTIVQGVGYPNPDFSHFRGINIKYTANTDKQEIRSGWVGRYLEQKYPNYPKGYPLQKSDGPPSLRIGVNVSPKITQGAEEDFSVGISNVADFASLDETTVDNDPVSMNLGGMNVSMIRSLSDQIRLYAPVIQEHSLKGQNLSKLYPEEGKNSLADQLKTVARLIGSGLNTRVYVVNQSGYDTHGDQVDRSDTTKGIHANLLKNLSEAIFAFQDDIQLMGKQEQVVGMTFSEFGRRITSSASYGTDHGTAETVLLFGTKVKNGIIGSSPQLPDNPTSEDNLEMQFDFRALYASVLQGWFGVSNENLKGIISQGSQERLELFKG